MGHSANDDALWDQFLEKLPTMRPFKKLSVEAKKFEPGEEVPRGELPAKYNGRFMSHKGIYVVYSNGNPVAWRGTGKQGKWLVPYDTRYDKVALEHQRLIRHAVKS